MSRELGTSHRTRRALRGVWMVCLVVVVCVDDARALSLPAPSPTENGEVLLKSAQTWDMQQLGEYYQYIPRWVTADSVPIAVIVHGTPNATDGQPGDAQDRALAYIERSVEWADRNQVILIAPVFDSTNFGSWNDPGSGNYRRLIGKPRGSLSDEEWGPDHFLNTIIDDFSGLYDEGQGLPYEVQEQVLLYGHSAGGQFVSRYLAKWPENVGAVFLSSPRRLTFPLGDPFTDGSISSACSSDLCDDLVNAFSYSSCLQSGGTNCDSIPHYEQQPDGSWECFDRGCNFPWAVLRSSPDTAWPDGGDSGSGSDPYNWTFDLDDANFDVAAEVPALIMVSEADEPPPPSGRDYGEVHYERSLAWATQMGSDWDTYSGGHNSANNQAQYAEPFFEEQAAVADDRHRHWWVPIF